MAKRGSSDKVKKIALAVLGVVLAVVFVYQLFISGPAPRPRRTAQPGSPTVPTSSAAKPALGVPQMRTLGAAAQQEALVQELLSDMTPLNLSLLSSGGAGSAKPGNRGSIFAYFVEPPPPPPPPPEPPPIQLVSIQPQNVVAGTPRAFTLVVTGNKIPVNAQILFDGAPRVTKRVGDTQLSTEVTPGDYAVSRNINVEVKSQSDPIKEFSNSIPFIIQPGPEPQFVYKGRLGALNQPQYNYGVFELTGTREIKRGKVGETIMGVWRIDVVASDYVDITHTQYEIRRRVPLQEKGR